MTNAISRATRRRIGRKASRLVDRIEELSARCELIKLARDEAAYFGCSGMLDSGAEFALYFAPDGLRYGEREADGFCMFEVYGPDGEHLWGYGGDGYDLEAEVCKCSR